MNIFVSLSKVLASSVVGATAEEDEGNDDESQASGQPQIPKENCYEVVGTLQDPTQHKPEWVDEVIEVSDSDRKFGATWTLYIPSEIWCIVDHCLISQPLCVQTLIGPE